MIQTTLIRLSFMVGVANFVLHAADPTRAALVAADDRRAAEVIQLKDASGKVIDLASHRGQVVLVDFWATWCGGCKEELPWFQQFSDKYRRKGFSVLAVSVDEEGWSVVRRFVAPLGLTLKIVHDDTDTAKRYDLKELPAAFLVDRQGRVAAKYVGLVDRADIESNIRTLLSERAPKRKY
jgi:thiol-disulfide isomerase/thioredoxin